MALVRARHPVFGVTMIPERTLAFDPEWQPVDDAAPGAPVVEEPAPQAAKPPVPSRRRAANDVGTPIFTELSGAQPAD